MRLVPSPSSAWTLSPVVALAAVDVFFGACGCGSGSVVTKCDDVCSPAESTECTGGKVRRCVADGRGCLAWSLSVDCDNGTCADARSCQVCNNACSPQSATDCFQGRIRLCETDVRGCRDWGAWVNCEQGVCADAHTCFECSNDCGTVYYVRPDGDDANSGTGNTPAQAWRTTNKCTTTVVAGDTCRIQSGTYDESATISQSGTPGKIITIVGDNNPIMEGNSTRATAITATDIEYFTISGLTIRNYTTSGIGYLMNGSTKSHITISSNNFVNDFEAIRLASESMGEINYAVVKGNVITGSRITSVLNANINLQNTINYAVVSDNEITGISKGGSGISWNYGHDNLFSNNKISDVGYAITTYQGTETTISGNLIDTASRGIRIDLGHKTVFIYGNTIRNVGAYTFSGYGIELYFDVSGEALNNTFVDSTMYCEGCDDFVFSNNIFDNSQIDLGLDTTPSANILFSNNVVKDNFLVVTPGNSGAATNIAIRNNIFINAGYSGSSESAITNFHRYGDISGLIIDNNVFYSSPNGAVTIDNVGADSNVYLRNNIFLDTVGSAINVANGNGDSIAAGFNLFYGGGAENVLGTTSLGNDLFVDPLFANPGSGDFHLKSRNGRWNGTGWENDPVTSPAIDAGDPTSDYSLEPSPNGSRIDMGAYGNTPEASKSGSGRFGSTRNRLRT